MEVDTTFRLLLKKVIFSLLIMIFLVSCTRGVWLTKDMYRPKKPKFTILKTPFVANDLVDTTHLYVGIRKPTSYNNGQGYMGFYSDGRMIVDRVAFDMETSEQALTTRNSYGTAVAIGYYTTLGDHMKIQFFTSFDGGTYEDLEAEIIRDTIFLNHDPGFSNIRDTLVKSAFRLK